MQGCVRRCTKLHNPNWIPGCIFKKIFRSVHPALVLFNKGLWNKNERKQKQQRPDSPFSIKGATHLMILMHINNHAKHIRTRQTNLPTSSRFPFVSWPCDPCPCYTNWDRLAPTRCTASWSLGIEMNWVSAVLEVCHAGVLSRCPTATYGIGTKQEKIMGHTFVVSPNVFPTFSSLFPDV